MTWNIRQALVRESDVVAALYRRVANREWTFLYPHTGAEDRAFFRERLFGNCTVWVAVVDGEIIGFCAVRRGWVDHLHVDHAWHGQGVGRALMVKALAGRQRVRLWTFQINARSRRFYSRQGFQEIHFTDGRDNEEREPDVLLEWRRVRMPEPSRDAW